MRLFIVLAAFSAGAGAAFADGDWDPVAGNGIDLPANTALSALHVFGGQMYIGTENTSGGARIYRTDDGNTFTAVMTGGFGDGVDRINDFEEFGGFLYAGTSSPAGGSVYRSSDGTTWTLASPVGLGSVDNSDVLALANFKGALYAGTKNSGGSGAQLWRSSDGTTWTTSVTTSGFGDADNTAINDLEASGWFLYAVTSNSVDGGELFRVDPDDFFIDLIDDGFGSSHNTAFTALEVYCGRLYIGTRNDADGYELWSTPDDFHFDLHIDSGLGDQQNVEVTDLYTAGTALYVGVESSGGEAFEVARTCDGWDFSQEDADGFGDPGNFRTNQFVTFAGDVWTGTSNPAGGGLYRTSLVGSDGHDDHHDDDDHHGHGHCFVATAAYGSPGAPRVAELRKLRDERVESCESGRNFTDLYRNAAPPVARVVGRSEILRALVRKALLK